MTWVMVAVAGGGALLGAYQKKTAADAQQRQQKAAMLGNAAQIQYSPWTHAAVNMMGDNAADPNSAMIEGGLQGGLTGAMVASQFKGTPTQETPLAGDQAVASNAAQSPAFGMDVQNGGSPYMRMQKQNMFGSSKF